MLCFIMVNPTEGFFIDAPVYIGKAGESTAAIPCTSLQSNTGGNTLVAQ